MLTHFAVKNFRGFADRIEWNIGNPSNYDFNLYTIKNNVIKIGIIYGPNGSGKTNFGLAIFDIVNHLTQKKKKFDYLINFANGGHQGELVDFEYIFTINGYVLEYNYSKSSNGTLKKEELIVNKKLIFHNENNSLEISDDFQLKAQTISDLANSANNVSIINFLLSSYPLPEDHYLILLQNFVDSMLWFRSVDERDFIGLESQVSNIDEYIISQNLANDFSSFIEETSAQKYNFAKQKSTDKQLKYLVNGQELAFSKPFISTGTDTLKLLYYWYKHLNNASFVFIDEFDAFYHFKLSLAVCRKLFELNCQLFMTTHNTMLMTNDLLRPDCAFILKNNNIKPLNSLTNKELRFGHNIEKLYRGGTFD